jgi:predicted nucleic acid-binding protein
LRFLDSSVFLYAYIRPRRRPPPEVEDDKRMAQAIIRRVQGGEMVTTTVVHVSETANILEARAPLEEARSIILDILNMDTIRVTPVDSARYLRAVQVAEAHGVGTNDALAYVAMVEGGVSEVYSFDRHFDVLPGVTRLWG